MPIKTSGSTGTEIPTGTQVSWRVREAAFDPNGRFGPTIELDLDIVTNEYIGTSTKYWARIQQPRLDKVAKLRGEGVEDELITAILQKQGFEFDELDELDEMLVGRSGALYSILQAGQGDGNAAEKVLEQCDNFDELAARLVGGRFVGTTKLSKDGYVRLDATEDIFKDVAVADEDAEEDFDSIPF
jgi:hypothetical protein